MGGRGGGGAGGVKWINLYHRTSSDRADSIVAQQEFHGDMQHAYFSTRKNGASKQHGSAVVSVRMPEKLIDVAHKGGNGGWSHYHLSGERDAALNPTWLKGMGLKINRVK
jgi:hypothetical protein